MGTMDAMFILVLVLIVVWYFRYMNNYYQAKKFVYRMYELRDRHRQLAALGLIPENEMFHYFDRSFCRAIKNHRYLNLYTILYLHKKHKDERVTQKNELILREYCEKHPLLTEVYSDYRKTIFSYIKGQHKFSFVLANTVAKLVLKSFRLAIKTNQVSKQVTEAIKGLLVYPEFSESSSMNLRALHKTNFV